MPSLDRATSGLVSEEVVVLSSDTRSVSTTRDFSLSTTTALDDMASIDDIDNQTIATRAPRTWSRRTPKLRGYKAALFVCAAQAASSTIGRGPGQSSRPRVFKRDTHNVISLSGISPLSKGH